MAGEAGLFVSGEAPLRAASAPALVPSFEGCEELSGEWMRRPSAGWSGCAPYWDRSCVRLFWYLEAGQCWFEILYECVARMLEEPWAAAEGGGGSCAALKRIGRAIDVPFLCNVTFLQNEKG